MSKRQRPSADVPKESEEEEDESGDDGEEGEGGSETSETSSDGDSDEYPEVSDKEEDDDDDDDEEEGGEKQKEIVIDFEFFPPKEIDFHGLKTLLFTYLDGAQYDSSGLVNAILKQDNVGSVVKTSEEDDPIAVFTVLNTASNKHEEWLKQAREFLVAKCGDASLKQKLAEAIDQEGTGLLLNERLMNSPPSLAPPLMQFLFHEIKEATQDQELSKQERDAFRFKRFLVATRVYQDNERSGGADEAGPSSSRGDGQKGKKQKKAAAPAGSEPVLVYLRPEDEFLHAQCAWSFTFPVENRPMGKDDLQPLRMVMLVDAGKIASVCKKLDAVVPNMAAGM